LISGQKRQSAENRRDGGVGCSIANSSVIRNEREEEKKGRKDEGRGQVPERLFLKGLSKVEKERGPNPTKVKSRRKKIQGPRGSERTHEEASEP